MPALRELPRSADDWLAEAREIFEAFRAALARHGVEPDPSLRLIKGEDLNPYYEPDSVTIGLGMPGTEEPKDRLYWLFTARYWGLSSVDEALEAMLAQLPFLMTHETTHHLRHRYGAPTENDFIEEQIVNTVALAFVRGHPVYRETVPKLIDLSRRSRERQQESGEPLEHLKGFRADVGEVLVARGQIDRERLDDLRELASRAGNPLPEIIGDAGVVSAEELEDALRAHAEAETYFNTSYMADLVEYSSFFDEWVGAYLERGELPTLAETLEEHILTEDWERSRRSETLRLLRIALHHPTDELAATAAEAITEEAGAEAVPALLEAVIHSPGVRTQQACLLALARLAPEDPEARSAAKVRSGDPEPRLSAAAHALLLAGGIGDRDEARSRLAAMLARSQPERNAALEALARIADPRLVDAVNEQVAGMTADERVLALRAMNRVREGADRAALLAEWLDDPSPTVRAEAARLAGGIGSELLLAKVARRLGDPAATVRQAASESLRAGGDAALRALQEQAVEGPGRAEAALLRRELGDRETDGELRDLLIAAASRAGDLRMLRQAIGGESGAALVFGDAIAAEERAVATEALRMAGALGNPVAMSLALRGLTSSDAHLHATALELARTAAPPDLRDSVEPLLIETPPAGTAPPRAVVLQTFRADPDPFVREMVEHLRESAPERDDAEMLTSVEKIMFLRAVPLFAAVDPRDLRSLAEDFRHARYEPGEAIFEVGDESSAVFVVVSGRVAVERPQQEGPPTLVAELGPRHWLGETSLLSGRPRESTARARKPTSVLSIDGEKFIELANRQPQVLVEIVRTLSERLRNSRGETAAPGDEEIERGMSAIWSGSALRRLPEELRGGG